MHTYISAPVYQNSDCFLSSFSSHEKKQTVGILLHIIIRKKKKKKEAVGCLLSLYKIMFFYTLLKYESVNQHFRRK